MMFTKCLKKCLFMLSQLAKKLHLMNIPVATQLSVAASVMQHSCVRNTLRLVLRTARLWV